MESTITQTGNSLCVIIPRDIAKLMRLEKGTPIELEYDGKRLVIWR